MKKILSILGNKITKIVLIALLALGTLSGAGVYGARTVSRFSSLSDVNMTGVANGEVPAYNATSGLYEPSSGGGTTATTSIFTGADTTGQTFYYDTADGLQHATTSIFVKSDGKVGIGTVTPAAMLDVKSTVSAFKVQNDTGAVYMSVSNGVVSLSTSGGRTEVAAAGNLGARLNVGSLSTSTVPLAIAGLSGMDNNLFEVNSVGDLSGDYFVIDKDGNTGIGVTVPLAKLHVSSTLDDGENGMYETYTSIGLATETGFITKVIDVQGNSGDDVDTEIAGINLSYTANSSPAETYGYVASGPWNYLLTHDGADDGEAGYDLIIGGSDAGDVESGNGLDGGALGIQAGAGGDGWETGDNNGGDGANLNLIGGLGGAENAGGVAGTPGNVILLYSQEEDDYFGKVGIGTSTPAAELDVEGEATFSGIAGDGTGKAVCIKADGNLGTCTDAVGGAGTCTCS